MRRGMRGSAGRWGLPRARGGRRFRGEKNSPGTPRQKERLRERLVGVQSTGEMSRGGVAGGCATACHGVTGMVIRVARGLSARGGAAHGA